MTPQNARGSSRVEAWWAVPAREIGRVHRRIVPRPEADRETLGAMPGGRLLPWAVVLATVLFSLFRLTQTDVYTDSLPLMVSALVAGLVAPTLGVLFVVLHAAFDLVASLPTYVDWATPWRNPHHFRIYPWALAGRVLSWWFLWLLAVEIPLAHRRAVAAASERFNRGAKIALSVVGSALLTGSLVYLWTLAAPILIRPVFTWRNESPTVDAVALLQVSGMRLVLASLVLSVVASAIGLRWGALEPGADAPTGEARSARPAGLGTTLLVSLLVVFALGGMIAGPLDAALLFTALVVSGPLAALVGRAGGLGALLGRAPYGVRFLLGALVTYLVARGITAVWFRPAAGSEFFPIVLSVSVGIILFAVLLRAAPDATRSRPSQTPSPPAERASVFFFVAAAFTLLRQLIAPAVAHADNCSSLGDCYGSAAAAAAAAAGAAAAAAATAGCAWPWGGPPPSQSGRKHFKTGGTPEIEFSVDYDCVTQAATVRDLRWPDDLVVEKPDVTPTWNGKGWDITVKYKERKPLGAPKYGEGGAVVKTEQKVFHRGIKC